MSMKNALMKIRKVFGLLSCLFKMHDIVCDEDGLYCEDCLYDKIL